MSLYTTTSVLAVQAPAIVDLALWRDDRQDVPQRYEMPSVSMIPPLFYVSAGERLTAFGGIS